VRRKLLPFGNGLDDPECDVSTCAKEHDVVLAVVVDETSRPEEEMAELFVARVDDAEVLAAGCMVFATQLLVFLVREVCETASQVVDDLAESQWPSSNDTELGLASLVRIPSRAGDLDAAVRHIELKIAAGMRGEGISLIFGLALEVLLDRVDLEQRIDRVTNTVA